MARAVGGLAVAVAVVLVGALAPSRAHAWTDAHVQGAEARVEMGPDGRAEVALTLSLRIRGGWLQGLEVAGLEPDATLLEEPRMISIPPKPDEGEAREAPERFHPRASVREPRRGAEDARIQLSFGRRESPRRGRYRIELRYATDMSARLMPADGGWKGEWTLPAWRSGLDGVVIEIVLPEGARFDAAAPPRALVDRSRRAEDGRTTLRWELAHLPRTTSWQLPFVLPEGALDPALAERLRGEAEPAGEAGRSEDAAEPDGPETPTSATRTAPVRDPFALPWWLALWVAVTMGLTGELFEREAKRRRARPHALVPMPRSLRPLVILGLVALDASAFLPRAAVILAIVAVGWRRSAEPAAPKPGRWVRLGATESLPGASALPWVARAIGVSSLAVGGWLTGDPATPSWAVVALVAPLLHGGARRLPPSLAERRERLLVLAEKLRAPLEPSGAALALVVHSDDDGPSDVRLRWVLDGPRPGMHRLDIVLTDERGPGGLLRKARLLVVADADSVAERHLSRHPIPAEVGPTRLPGGRVMWLHRIAEVQPVLEALQHGARTTTDQRPSAPLRSAA